MPPVSGLLNVETACELHMYIRIFLLHEGEDGGIRCRSEELGEYGMLVYVSLHHQY